MNPLLSLSSHRNRRIFRGLRWVAFLFSVTAAVLGHAAADYETKPDDPYFKKWNLRRAPAPGALVLKQGDKLTIVGDSITEQKMYSRIIETYLAACRPDLGVEVRQLGWSGETVEGFRKRLASDCLRFGPNVVTLCYGMNDSKYRPYDELNGVWFRENLTAVVRELKAKGAQVVVGSPGIAEKYAVWVAARAGTLDEHNLHLGTLRDIAIDVAETEQTRFADVFWPMLKSGFTARARYGGNPDQPYFLAGGDGIHPGWAGQLVMAYAFLRGLGFDGDIGTITVDLPAKTVTASDGHKLDSFDGRVITLTSSRYPFCAVGPADRDDSIRSGMSLVPFNAELNRFLLIVRDSGAKGYTIKWGDEIRVYSPEQLAKGVNLADDFQNNPFSAAFAQIDKAVTAKQAYETRQIKQLMHGPEGQKDQEATVTQTEAARAKLVQEVRKQIVPVQHKIEINRW